MFPLNHLINSSNFYPQNLISTSSVYHQLTVNKQVKPKPKLKSRRPTTTTTILNTIATSSIFSVNTTNINSSFSTSTSSTQQQHISFEDSYSAKTGIKTAALLGGMLFLVIVYLLWKARQRICRVSRSSSTGLGNPHLSSSKFDLDYWLKQVDLLEAKEAERNRGGQSLYLELPKVEARDNQDATASWIVDAYRHWRLRQYRQQQQFFRQPVESQQTENESKPYRRRRNPFRQLVRRLFTSSQRRPSFNFENSPSLLAGMRPSIVSNYFIPPPLTPSLQPRRTSSWPRLKSTHHHQTGTPMSALQTHLARKRLLKRTSRTTLDI